MAGGKEHDVLTIQKLREHRVSVVGASSLLLGRQNSPPSNSDFQYMTHKPGFQSKSLTLKPWSSPAILKGRINLSVDSKFKCLNFVDHTSASVSCAVLELEPSVIGLTVEVHAWNFICTANGDGFLEIIKWKPPEDCEKAEESCALPHSRPSEDLLLETPPSKRKHSHEGKDTGNVTAHGRLHAMSAPFVLPCRAGSKHVSKKVLAGRNVNKDVSSGTDLNDRLEIRNESCSALLKGSSYEVHTEGISKKRQRIAKTAAVSLVENCNLYEELVPGFLIELQPCKHRGNLNTLRNFPSDLYVEISDLEFVYFTGSVSAWRPVLSMLFGKCLQITALKRRRMVVGEEKDTYTVFIATRTSVFYLTCKENPSSFLTCGFHNKQYAAIKGNGILNNTPRDDYFTEKNSRKMENSLIRKQNLDSSLFMTTPFISLISKTENKHRRRSGSYIGTVTAIYMNGLLLRLDKNVWVMLSHQPLAQIHGLRIGAILALTHFHFIELKTVWEKLMLLGACFRSHVAVKSFSPLNCSLNTKPFSQSLLSRFIESLSLTCGFWALVLTACFRFKFRGILSDKHIVGSKKHEGMVQKYIQMRCASFPSLQRDILKEFFKHDCSCPMNKTSDVFPLLIVPINIFSQQIEMMWVDQSSAIWTKNWQRIHGEDSIGKNDDFYFKKKSCFFARRILSSKDMNIILLGILQVSPETGHLQLVDATGAINVIIPDCKQFSSLSKLYEIRNYTIVVEGVLQSFFLDRKEQVTPPVSFARLMEGAVSRSKRCPLLYYVHFYLNDAVEFSIPRPTSASLSVDGLKNVEARQIQFQILLITHKYTTYKKGNVSESHAFAEATILPFSILTGIHKRSSPEDVLIAGSDVSSDGETLGGNGSFEHDVNLPLKFSKRRLHGSTEKAGAEKSYETSSTKSSIRCLLYAKELNENVIFPVMLHMEDNSELEEGIMDFDKLRKALLEFNCESMSHHQLLQIGACYLMQFDNEGCSSVSALQQSSLKTSKIKVSSVTLIWNISFVCSDHFAEYKSLQKGNYFQEVSDDQNCLTFYTCDMMGCSSINTSEKKMCLDGCKNDFPSDVHKDAILYLPCHALSRFQHLVGQIKMRGTPHFGNFHDDPVNCLFNLSHSNNPLQLVDTHTCGKGTTSDVNLPEGELVSFEGAVEAIFIEDLNVLLNEIGSSKPFFYRNAGPSSLQQATYLVNLQSPYGPQKVHLRCMCQKFVFPLGFGPGAFASFHRILLQSGSKGKKELLIVPASFIVIQFIKEIHIHLKGRLDALHQLSAPVYLQRHASTLISSLSQMSIGRSMRLVSRVVAVPNIVFEWQPGNHSATSMLPFGDFEFIHIMHGTFILDDGSGLCCCQANGARAAHLLGLQFLSRDDIFLEVASAHTASESTGDNFKIVPYVLLRRLVKKHRRIEIQSSFAANSLNTELNILNSSCENLNAEDHKLILLVLLKACNALPLMVLGNIHTTESGGVRIEKYFFNDVDSGTLAECRIIWANYVSPVNYLQELDSVYGSMDFRE